MLYALFALIALFVAFMIIRTDRKRDKHQQDLKVVTNYIVMEEEDEALLDEALAPMEELSQRYPWFEPRTVICRVDRAGNHHEAEWKKLQSYTYYEKDKEPYYLFFREHQTSEGIPWDHKVFETADVEEAKQFILTYESNTKQVYSNH